MEKRGLADLVAIVKEMQIEINTLSNKLYVMDNLMKDVQVLKSWRQTCLKKLRDSRIVEKVGVED